VNGEIDDSAFPSHFKLFPSDFADSPLGPIPKGWRVGTLADVVAIYDSLRVPLSNRQREQRRGPYPYYGAASQMDSVDDYLFDGVYVLMGEDGSVIKDDGTPVLQYVWGKFWVNSHAHVLLHLKSCNITPFVTGAVQPKLNQGNMNRISLIHAREAINRMCGTLIAPLFARIRQASDESRTLAALRDALLPKLISGELRVPDAERIVGRAT
jgi:type I restriction enzyme S subunit